MTYAKVIADSINENGDRLTTFEVRFHRFVLAEFNTHRVFSRNSASSRAIPVEKQLKAVSENPAWPVVWASEQPGMQGGTELTNAPDRSPGSLWDAQDLFQNIHEYTVARIMAYLEEHPNKSDFVSLFVAGGALEISDLFSFSLVNLEGSLAQRLFTDPELRAGMDKVKSDGIFYREMLCVEAEE